MIKMIGAGQPLRNPVARPAHYPDSPKGSMLLRQLDAAYSDGEGPAVPLELLEIFSPPIPLDCPLTSILTNILDCDTPMPSVLSLLDEDDDTTPTVTLNDLALLMNGILLALQNSYKKLGSRAVSLRRSSEHGSLGSGGDLHSTSPALCKRYDEKWEGPYYTDVIEQAERLAEVIATFVFMRWVVQSVRPIVEARATLFEGNIDLGNGTVVSGPRAAIWKVIFERVSHGVIVSLANALLTRRSDVSPASFWPVRIVLMLFCCRRCGLRPRSKTTSL